MLTCLFLQWFYAETQDLSKWFAVYEFIVLIPCLFSYKIVVIVQELSQSTDSACGSASWLHG